MNAHTLRHAMLNEVSLERCRELIDGCNHAMLLGNMNTVQRAAMFLAQIGVESGSLKYTEEIGKGKGQPYFPYCGRTFIQITWDYNYLAFGEWCVKEGLIKHPRLFVNEPHLLRRDRWAWLGPIWYWRTHRLNQYADKGDVSGCTKVINGGYNGLEQRVQRYNHCVELGNAILPTQPATPLNLPLDSTEAPAEEPTDPPSEQ